MIIYFIFTKPDTICWCLRRLPQCYFVPHWIVLLRCQCTAPCRYCLCPTDSPGYWGYNIRLWLTHTYITRTHCRSYDLNACLLQKKKKKSFFKLKLWDLWWMVIKAKNMICAQQPWLSNVHFLKTECKCKIKLQACILEFCASVSEKYRFF